MKVHAGGIEGLKIVELQIWKDSRGFFTERFQRDHFAELGLPTVFVQDNHSRSFPRILRGLHFQQDPAQGKLISVLRGKIWDVAVDIRKDSPTFGKSFGIELSDDNGLLLWIPPGFAHGFCVLGDECADVLYKVDSLYNPKTEGGIFWADPELNLKWPIQAPIISERDQKLPSFQNWKERWKI